MRDNVFIICDSAVTSYARNLAPGRPLMQITADEAHKTIDTVLQICRWLLDNGAGRDALLYAVGGGCTTDIVGFAAAIYKRGVRYVNCPTTLLAMVDASLGGKTGVNLDGYKNMLGCFKLPLKVEVDTSVLQTLSAKEFRSGAAEMIKTFIVADKNCYTKAIALFSGPFRSVLDGTSTTGALPEEAMQKLGSLIDEARLIKHRITESDPFDEGERRSLNLGHTWAHAIEWWQSGRDNCCTYAHGEAVAIGIVQAARHSEALGTAPKGLAAQLEADLASCGLPTALPCSEQELLPAMQRDKKNEDGHINAVLIAKIGKTTIGKI